MAASAPAASPFLRQVRNAIDAGDGDMTVRAWQRHLVRHPEDVAVRRQLADHLERRGEAELAAEHRRLAAEREPGNDELWIEWAATLRGIGWHQEAETVLARAAARTSNVAVHSALGIVRDALLDHPGAESAHRQALANASTADSALHNNLGFNLLLQKRYPEAIQEFRRALSLRPRSAEARGNLARALAAEGSAAALTEARRHWQSIGSTASMHNNVGAALLEQGRFAEARQELNAALNADPTHRAALDNLTLAAQLDGGRAEWTRTAPPSTWRRLQAALRRWFSSPPPVTVASEQASR